MLDNRLLKEENKAILSLKQNSETECLKLELRRKNVVIKRVQDDKNESKKQTRRQVVALMMLAATWTRIGLYNTNGRRPILLKLATGWMKMDVLKAIKV